MTSSIEGVTKNRHILDIFHMAVEREEEKVYSFPLASRPLYPRDLHEILRLAIVGTILRFVAKFGNTRTTQQMFSRSENTFHKDAEKAEERLVFFRDNYFMM
ncbi:hypothetical protein JTB14_007236 [Gonioctena quinquepunctata]|nr:hypothetical protein JTB14_007236 [Gonioctena quinquepunctata]